MSRRRYVSTRISQDTRVNRLAVEYGDFAALLYTWMIPHAGDDGTLPGDPEELLYQVLPARRDKGVGDVLAALDGMAALGLIESIADGRIAFPAESFYRYQTYIKDRNKRGEESREPARNAATGDGGNVSAANQRESAQDAVSPSFPVSPSPSFPVSPSPSFPVSPSPSFSQGVAPPDPALSVPAGTGPAAAVVPEAADLGEGGEADEVPTTGRRIRPAPKPTTLTRAQMVRFERWYGPYPRHEKRPEAEAAWAKLDPDDALTDQLVADVEARKLGRKWAENFINLPANYLRQRIWEDDIEPVRDPPTSPSRPAANGRLSHEDAVAAAKRLNRQRAGPAPPAGQVIDVPFVERRH